jgi:hypothetical protein
VPHRPARTPMTREQYRIDHTEMQMDRNEMRNEIV